MAAESGAAEEDFDFSRQPTANRTNSGSSTGQNGTNETGDDGEIPKNKRIACVVCRKRKLKCDGNRPKCATCARLKHNCAYDEVRRKSGPKRGYVKELEARLAQVEAQVKYKDEGLNGDEISADQDSNTAPNTNGVPQTIPEVLEPPGMENGVPYAASNGTVDAMGSNDTFNMPGPQYIPDVGQDMLNMPDPSLDMGSNFSWEMISLGLEEPMPTQEAIDELTNVYFEKLHPSLPMLHKYRYQTSLSLPPQSRPPICLRYAMWAHAASITDKYMHHQDIFYRRSRKYIELDEMKGSGESFISVAHAQTWALLCAYEFKMMYFPRAWMSAGRGSRMVLMMGLNRVDGLGLDVKQCLPPPADWTEREERRRTFWMCYCCDRYASIGTGWPMTIDEKDIKTNLPATEEAYDSSTAQKTSPLNEAMTHVQVAHMSAFAGVIYVTHFFGLNLLHLHRPEANDGEDSLQGPFWKRHRHMDNILLNTSLSLPSHLRLPAGVRSANIVFLNFAIHAATICLHQAAIFKAEKNQMPRNIIEQSRSRCILAASEISTVMRMTSHLDVTGMNPFMAFCLYVAARVFVQYLKKSPSDEETRTSLEFLLTAMSALKRKNPISESFMVQLQLDIEGSGLDIMLHNPDFSTLHNGMNPNVRERMKTSLKGPSPTYCSPSPKPHEGGSDDSVKSPETLNDSGPTVRSESPRQTQYAFRNIELQARESRQLPTFEGPGKGWNMQYSETAPVGMNPLFNNNINVNPFDVDMMENTNPSYSGSDGRTPQSTTTYRSSPHTSYSPPQVEDEVNGLSQQHSKSSMLTPPSDPLFPSPNIQGAQSPVSAGLEGSFKAPQGWDMGNNVVSPGFSGLTPGGNWDKMMQDAGMLWDEQRTGMTPQ